MANSSVTPVDLSVNSSTSVGGPLWYQFPVCAVAPYAFVFYFGVKVFNLAVGTPCNLLVLWKILSRKRDFSTADTFILNLAVLDAYFCLMSPVDMLNRLVLENETVWYFQRLAYGVKDTAPLFLVCICVDRYFAVTHPVLFSGVRDNKLRTAVSAAVWCMILAYGLTKCTLGVMSVNEVFSGVILFSFAVMVFCNASVIWALRRSVAGKEEMHPVKRRALKMVLKIVAIVIVNYLPPVALMPFFSFYTFVQFRCQVSVSVFSIMDLSCSIEPLLYLTKGGAGGGAGGEGGEGGCCWPGPGGRGRSKKPLDVKV